MLTSFHLGEIGETWTASSYDAGDQGIKQGSIVTITAVSAEVAGQTCEAKIVGRPEGRRPKGCHSYLVQRVQS